MLFLVAVILTGYLGYRRRGWWWFPAALALVAWVVDGMRGSGGGLRLDVATLLFLLVAAYVGYGIGVAVAKRSKPTRTE
jgi:hypothetical protein